MFFTFNTKDEARIFAEDCVFDEINEVDCYIISMWVDGLVESLKAELINDIYEELEKRNIKGGNVNNNKYIKLCREFYTAYGYFQAMSEFNLTDALMDFLDKAYDIFASMGNKYLLKFDDITWGIWEAENRFYTIRDEINPVEIVEEIEEVFRYANF